MVAAAAPQPPLLAVLEWVGGITLNKRTIPIFSSTNLATRLHVGRSGLVPFPRRGKTFRSLESRLDKLVHVGNVFKVINPGIARRCTDLEISRVFLDAPILVSGKR